MLHKSLVLHKVSHAHVPNGAAPGGADFPVEVAPAHEPPGCRCGEILRGVLLPTECPLFGQVCTPQMPVGPCRVSAEGVCAAYYRYVARNMM